MLKYKKHGAVCTAILILAICTSVFVSCTGVKNGGTLLDYQNSLAGASVEWEYNGDVYKADITFEGEIPEKAVRYRNASVTITSPEEVSGMTVSYSADGASASVGSVSFPLTGNMGEELYRVVRSLSLYKDEVKGAGNGSGEITAVRFEADLFGGITEYNITYDDEKYPESAVITWDSGEMTVRYVDFEKAGSIST